MPLKFKTVFLKKYAMAIQIDLAYKRFLYFKSFPLIFSFLLWKCWGVLLFMFKHILCVICIWSILGKKMYIADLCWILSLCYVLCIAIHDTIHGVYRKNDTGPIWWSCCVLIHDSFSSEWKTIHYVLMFIYIQSK